MKCPLFHRPKLDEPGLITYETSDCLKEDCAWWIADINMCAIRDLALELRYTQFRLQDMANKMPHEEQFRR